MKSSNCSVALSALRWVRRMPQQPRHRQVDRTQLPIHEPEYPPITELDARKATPPPRFEVRRQRMLPMW